MTLGRFTIRDVPRNNGVLNVTGVITRSSNVVRPGCGEDAGPDLLRRRAPLAMARRRTVVSRESAGVVMRPARWSGTTKTTMSYGYGLSVTPLPDRYGVFGAGQRRQVDRADLRQGQRNEGQRIIDENVARQVVAMMETCGHPGRCQAGGPCWATAWPARPVPRARPAPGGYERGHYNALFAGVVPATNPRFATVIVIVNNDPQA